MPVVVEAAAGDNHRHFLLRHLPDLLCKGLCRRNPVRIQTEFFRFTHGFPDSHVKEFLHVHSRRGIPPDGILGPEGFLALPDYQVLGVPHGQDFFLCQGKKLFQGQLLIDGIGAVECASVRSLYAGDAGCQVVLQGMAFHHAQVVQTYIGRDLEFQNHLIVRDGADELFPLRGLEI